MRRRAEWNKDRKARPIRLSDPMGFYSHTRRGTTRLNCILPFMCAEGSVTPIAMTTQFETAFSLTCVTMPVICTVSCPCLQSVTHVQTRWPALDLHQCSMYIPIYCSMDLSRCCVMHTVLIVHGDLLSAMLLTSYEIHNKRR